MTVNVPAARKPTIGSRQWSLTKALASALPGYRINVHSDKIEIGKHSVKLSPGLIAWLKDATNKPVKVFLKRKTMTAYVIANS